MFTFYRIKFKQSKNRAKKFDHGFCISTIEKKIWRNMYHQIITWKQNKKTVQHSWYFWHLFALLCVGTAFLRCTIFFLFRPFKTLLFVVLFSCRNLFIILSSLPYHLPIGLFVVCFFLTRTETFYCDRKFTFVKIFPKIVSYTEFYKCHSVIFYYTEFCFGSTVRNHYHITILCIETSWNII